MDWLKNELTPIDKVRRNVILLAALAALLAFFPVRTDEVSFLGAKFTSEVVAFGIFHALVFYAITLAVRAVVHTDLSELDFEKLQAEHETKISESMTELREARERSARAFSEFQNEYLNSVSKISERIRGLRIQIAAAIASASQEGSTEHDARDAFRAMKPLDAEIKEAQRERRDLSKIAARNRKEHKRNFDEIAHRTRKAIRPLSAAQSLSHFVFFGEYVLPIVMAIVALGFLAKSQSFPMLWELKLYEHKVMSVIK